MTNPFKKLTQYVLESLRNGRKAMRHTERQAHMMVDNYLDQHLFKNEKYQDPKKLNKYEFQVYSQNGEDGIIEEIFKRIGTTNKFFIEFGVDNGLENNTAYLLLKDWSGLWIDGNPNFISTIREKYGFLIDQKKLFVKNAFINAENIESLFKEAGAPQEFDLISIDIDQNDYWVWKGITNYNPRVVVIEYNALIRPNTKFVVEYDAAKMWNQSMFHNASLQSLEILGKEKGYSLVGCNFVGANAFFVRNDLLKDLFAEPFTAENHYEPPRYYLTRQIGHPRDFGKFRNI
ncbi:MAG: hypothetical protein V4642_02275 [Bacteroidota bacterium]